jgi:hypothetical protein
MSIADVEVLPLNAGDKLSREEFLRRWEMHPEIKNAELIGGIVYMPSPVTIEHGDWESDLGTWLGVYRIATPGTASGHNSTALLLKDAPQPDINLRILPECGGSSRAKGKYLAGAPELMTEACRSSAAYDLHQKYELYEAAGVQEYLAVLLYEKEIRWHVLTGGRYQLLPPDADGVWRSRVFPGLWLDGQALLNRDMPKVLTVLQQGLQSPEHQAFVERLAKKRAGQ